MTQASLEREKSAQDLRDLVLQRKGTECSGKNSGDSTAQLDAIKPLGVAKYGPRIQTVRPEKVDEVGWCQVGVDVLHTQQRCKQQSTGQEARLLLCQNQRGNKKAIHASIVLEVYVINDQETW